MLVLGFLSSSLGLFPLGEIAASESEINEETPFSKEIVEETAGKLNAMYATIVSDIASFAGNPDLALAQDRRDDLVSYADTLADRLNLFADSLQAELDILTTAPSAPSSLTANGGSGVVTLDWDDNPEADLAGYNIYRSSIAGGPFGLLAAQLSTSAFIDADVVSGNTYYYIVTAVSASGTESDPSDEASATPLPQAGG